MIRSLYFWVFFLFCLWLFVVVFSWYFWFFSVTGLVFGMDLPNYKSFFGGMDHSSLLTHGFFILIASFFGGYVGLLWFVPFLLVCVVWLVFWLYRGFGFSWEISFFGVLWFCFGSFFLVFFGFCGLLAQLFGLVWVLLALNFLVRGFVPVGVFFAGVSVLAHYSNLGFWFLFLLGELWLFRRWFLFCLCGLTGLFLGVYLGWFVFLTPFSVYPVSEPLVFMMLAVYTYPISWIYLFFSRWFYSRYGRFICLLFLFCPFFHLGRFMVFIHVFMMPWAYWGYLNFRRFVFFRRVFPVFNVVFMFLWLEYFLSFMWHNLVFDMISRGLLGI